MARGKGVGRCDVDGGWMGAAGEGCRMWGVSIEGSPPPGPDAVAGAASCRAALDGTCVAPGPSSAVQPLLQFWQRTPKVGDQSGQATFLLFLLCVVLLGFGVSGFEFSVFRL